MLRLVRLVDERLARVARRAAPLGESMDDHCSWLRDLRSNQVACTAALRTSLTIRDPGRRRLEVAVFSGGAGAGGLIEFV